MSERIPSPEDILLALTTVGYTEDEAAAGIDQIKQRGIGIGHLAAQENMQASIGDAVRKLQAIAWDEGNRWGFEQHCNDQENCWDETEVAGDNPYREGGSNE